MAQVTTTAKRFSLTLNDWWKGLILAVVAPVIGIIQQSLTAGSLVFNWKMIFTVALSAATAYLLKNWLDAPRIVVTGASDATVKSVKEGTTDVKVGNTIAEVKNQ